MKRNLHYRTLMNLTVGRLYYTLFMHGKSAPQKRLVLSFDPDERSDMDRMPELLDTLKEHGVIGSFAAIGRWVEEYPEIWRRVLDEGHEILNHTQTHPDHVELNGRHYYDLTRTERAEEIRACHGTVLRVLGHTMKGFRIPHFGVQFTRDTYDILEDLGYAFSSSELAIPGRKKGPHRVGAITEFPLTCCPKHPWTIYDSAHAFRGRFSKHDPEEFIGLFSELLDSGLFLSIYLDPQDMDHYPFAALLAEIQERGIRTVRYEDLL